MNNTNTNPSTTAAYTAVGEFEETSLDLGHAECDPIHTEVCVFLGLDPKDAEISVSPINDWCDGLELGLDLENLVGKFQLFFAHESGQSYGSVVTCVQE